MSAKIPIHEKEAFYRPRFERLLKALEEHQLDFEGTQQRLLKALQPLEFDADILRHLPKFTGRQWVFDAIDQWLAENPPKQRVFWISGGPGVGKTAISAVLSSRYLEVAALHLCKFGHAQKSDPRSVVTSVVYQLTTQLPEYEARLASMDVEKLAQDDARTMFDNLLVQPLAKLTPPKRSIVILIDALDEATRDGRNELASFIAVEFPKTPAWLRLIITSRTEAEVTAPLQGLNPFILDTDIESNRADIRDYLRRELTSHLQNQPDPERLIEQIVAKSEGLFLYIERVCDDLQHGNLSLDHLDQFPQGLGGVYWQFFERKFPDHAQFKKEIRPALRAILAAREPLPVEILQRIFNWQDEELRDFTRPLGSLFPVAKEASGEVIKPYHKSIADWAADEGKAGPYFVSTLAGHRLLGEYCFHQWQAGSRFAISEVVHHLQFDTTSDNMLRVFLNPAYYERKFSKCGWVKLLDDLVCFASHPLGQNTQLSLDDSALEVRALFSIAALIVFDRDVPRSATILRRFVESGCNRELLEVEREKLRLEIASAELKPRTRREESNHFAANTAHFYEDYIEHLLKAEDAALALKPAEMIDCLKAALRFHAIYSCDGDPIGAVNIAIQEAAEDIITRLPTLQSVAFRLNAGIGKPEDDKMAKPEPPPGSTPKLNSGKQDTERENNSRNTVAEGPRTYVKHGAWCDMVDYSGRGFPQDMDFVCRKCGHCEGVGHPNEVPPACPKCGNEGRE